MNTPPKDTDTYLASLPASTRLALEKVRATIKSAAPEAVEAISYSMPVFKYRGRNLVYYAAFKNHCSFFPASSAVIVAHAADLATFETTKGTIHFTPSKPLSAPLIKKIVKTRLAEIDSRAK